jgi:putative ABC transport system permease protein
MLKYIPLEDLSLNGRVLGFTIILAVLTGLLFGLAPIWQVFRLELTSGLKVDATSVTSLRRGRVTLRNLLVVVQVTACFVLLLGACLCIRSFSKLSAVDPGFDKRNVMAASLAISHEKYSEEQSWVFMDQLLAHVQAMPGIKDQAVADMIIPFGGMAVATMATELEGYVVRPDERLVYSVNSIGPGVFRVLGIPVLLGRDFDQHDRGKNSTRVAIVNESFVRRYWPKSNPIGKHIDGAEVIGVVRDSQWKNLSEVADPRVFMAIFQGVKVTEMEARTITLWLKTDRDPMETASWLQSELRKLDPTSVELVQLESLERLHVAALAGQRSLMQLLVGLACGALVIAIIGLYGVLAYSVEQRTKEIGVRIAIGARPEYVLWLIIRQGMSLVGIGLVTGCIVSIAVTRGLGSWLYGISAHDKENYLGAAALLSVIAFIACWLPARRAARIDPAITLRSE